MGHRAHPQRHVSREEHGNGNGNRAQHAHTESKQSTQSSESVGSSIREGVEQTRERVSDKVQELREKAQPDALKAELAEMKESLARELRADLNRAENVAQNVEQRARSRARALADAVGKNPIPVAMAGVGLAWLAASALGAGNGRMPARTRKARNKSNGEERGDSGEVIERVLDQAGNKAAEVKNAIKQTTSEIAQQTEQRAQQARSKLAGATHSATERIGRMGRGVQSQSRELKARVTHSYGETPLLVGAALAAVGVGLGAAIPLSARERRMIGGVRESLRQSAQALAQETIGKVQGAAKRIGSIAEEAKE